MKIIDKINMLNEMFNDVYLKRKKTFEAWTFYHEIIDKINMLKKDPESNKTDLEYYEFAFEKVKPLYDRDMEKVSEYRIIGQYLFEEVTRLEDSCPFNSLSGRELRKYNQGILKALSMHMNEFVDKIDSIRAYSIDRMPGSPKGSKITDTTGNDAIKMSEARKAFYDLYDKICVNLKPEERAVIWFKYFVYPDKDWNTLKRLLEKEKLVYTVETWKDYHTNALNNVELLPLSEYIKILPTFTDF